MSGVLGRDRGPALREELKMPSGNKAARSKAKLKAKHRKERLRKKGLLKVRKPGGRMKPIRRGRD